MDFAKIFQGNGSNNKVNVDSFIDMLPGARQMVDMMSDALSGSSGALSTVLDWAYTQSISAKLPGMDDVESLAREYRCKYGDVETAADRLINDYWVRTGLVGAVTSTGGLPSLPINLLSSTFLQMRMVSAIALIGGWNLNNPTVKRASVLCVLGAQAADKIGEKTVQLATAAAAKKLTGKVASKSVPLISGIVGGTIDALATKGIGLAAKKCFITDIPHDLQTIDVEAEEL